MTDIDRRLPDRDRRVTDAHGFASSAEMRHERPEPPFGTSSAIGARDELSRAASHQ